jgi:hypothetical protein
MITQDILGIGGESQVILGLRESLAGKVPHRCEAKLGKITYIIFIKNNYYVFITTWIAAKRWNR